MKVFSCILLIAGLFCVSFSRFVLGAAGLGDLVYSWMLGFWLLLLSFWCIDPSLRTFVSKLKINQLTDDERRGARNCVLWWNVAAFLVFIAIFITVDELKVFDLNDKFDKNKCSNAAPTADDAAWRNSILAGTIMIGFGSLYGAIYFYNPANEILSVPKEMTPFEFKFYYIAARIVLMSLAVGPFLFGWFMAWWMWTLVTMIIGSAIPCFWCAFVLTNGWSDSLYISMVGED